MAQVLSPHMHSSPLLGNSAETSRWGDFDYSMIHPAHGISFDSWQDLGSMSQAEQLLSSLGFNNHTSSHTDSVEEEDLFNLDLARQSEDSQMDGRDIYHRQASSEPLEGMADDSAYDSSTSDSSVETVTPSTSMSLISIHDPSLSSFPFPEGAIHKSRRRSSATRKEQQIKPRYSPSIQLERISSCHFNPPTLSSQDVPLDATLQQQYISSTASTSSYTTRPYWASSPSSSSAMQASASSSMIRSYSAPTHTQAEYDLLKDKWNAESAAARAASSSAPSPFSPSIVHSASSGQLSPTRPSFARRATSAASSSSSSSAYTPSMGLRRTREYDEASASSPELSSYASVASEPYSSRTHLLSPLKRGNPLKRSRLAYVSEETSSYAATREHVFGGPYSSSTNEAGQAQPASSALTPPKSPNRPSLNRFFTSPEFFVGSGHSGADSSDDDEASLA